MITPHVTVVTLGVTDLSRARRFYEGLGLVASSQSNEHVVFLRAGAVVLSLFGRDALAVDAHVDANGHGFRGIALAWNVASEMEVDAALASAQRAGGRIVKEGQKVFWGGYSGYFADPDEHLWEVAHNPFWPLGADGTVELPA
jgi:predicted lactoylglutathione lyase